MDEIQLVRAMRIKKHYSKRKIILLVIYEIFLLIFFCLCGVLAKFQIFAISASIYPVLFLFPPLIFLSKNPIRQKAVFVETFYSIFKWIYIIGCIFYMAAETFQVWSFPECY